MEILKLKNIITEIKSLVDHLKSRMEETEEKSVNLKIKQ